MSMTQAYEVPLEERLRGVPQSLRMLIETDTWSSNTPVGYLCHEAADKIDRFEEALHRIAQWADAYPLAVFPEPDEAYYRKAHEVLTANGMTLDRLSAAAMRHVVQGVGKTAKDALGRNTDAQDTR